MRPLFFNPSTFFVEPLPRIPPPSPNERDAEKPKGAIRLIPQDGCPSEQNRLTADRGSIATVPTPSRENYPHPAPDGVALSLRPCHDIRMNRPHPRDFVAKKYEKSRKRIIELLCRGLSFGEAAKRLGKDKKSVWRVWQRFADKEERKRREKNIR